MPNYYPQYPDAEGLQHGRVGTSSNPYSNPKSQALYDEAAREYRDMLMSQGHNYDPSGNRGSNTSSRPVLLSEDPDRYRGIRTCQVLPAKEGHADRAESEVYDDSSSAAGKSAGGEQHRVDRGVIHYPVHVHLAAIGLAIIVSAVSYYLPILAGKVSHLSGLWWLVGGAVAYGVVCLFFYSILKSASLSDQQADEMGDIR